jgi:hypothetical protein
MKTALELLMEEYATKILAIADEKGEIYTREGNTLRIIEKKVYRRGYYQINPKPTSLNFGVGTDLLVCWEACQLMAKISRQFRTDQIQTILLWRDISWEHEKVRQTLDNLTYNNSTTYNALMRCEA